MSGPIHGALLARARETRAYLAAAVVVGTATAGLAIAQAWLLSRQVASVFDTHRLDGLAASLGWLALVLAARAALRGLNPWLGQRAAAAVKARLRRDVVSARLGRPVDPRSDTGGLVDLLTHGLDALDGYYAKYLPQLALALTVPLVVGAAVLLTDPLSALVLVLTVPLIPLFMALIGWTTERRMARRWAVQARLAHHFGDLVAGLPTLQAFGRARAQSVGLERTEERDREETTATLRISFLSSMTLELLATLSVAIIAVSIGLRTVAGEMDLQTGLFLLVLAPEVYLPLRQVGAHYHDSSQGVAAADRAFAEIDAPCVSSGPAPAPDPAHATIRVSDLAVTYPGCPRPAVQGVDLELAPGEIVGLVGPSGAGKSTLLAVLLGFVRPSAGQVMLHDTPLEDVDLAAWRAGIAWVGQLPALPEPTVAGNVAMGDPGAGPDRLRAVLDRAGATDLPLDRPVGDEGEGLSDGERRRVGLARALLRLEAGAGLLLLDEPTAGLDADTEARVLATLRDRRATVLVVTHRPAVMAACDRLVTIGSVPVEVAS